MPTGQAQTWRRMPPIADAEAEEVADDLALGDRVAARRAAGPRRACWRSLSHCMPSLGCCQGGSGGRRAATPAVETHDAAGTADAGDQPLRAASHPDFHRRSWSSTRSTGRWLRPGRGLSPPVRSYTDPGARVRVRPQYARDRWSGEGQGDAHIAQRGIAEERVADADGRNELVAVVDGADDGHGLRVLPDVDRRVRDAGQPSFARSRMLYAQPGRVYRMTPGMRSAWHPARGGRHGFHGRSGSSSRPWPSRNSGVAITTAATSSGP